jgi:hypothetical protein
MEGQLPPRASLLGVPRELQDAIAAHLDTSPPRTSTRQSCYLADRTVLDLSYTCKALRTTCLPFLFSNITLAAYVSRPDRSPGRETALLRALEVSPRIGEYVKMLHISRLDPADKIADEILRHTPNLVSLTLEYGLDCDKDHALKPIDTRRLAAALQHVRETLEELTISYKLDTLQPRPPRGQRSPSVLHCACSLKHLGALKHLSIPLGVLLGDEVNQRLPLENMLPSSLVSVYLGGAPQHGSPTALEPLYAALEPFVEGKNWKRFMPHLRSVSGCISAWKTGHISDRPGGIKELYARNKAVRRLLISNGLEYPVNVHRLLDENGLIPPSDEIFRCTDDLEEWEELEDDDLD